MTNAQLIAGDPGWLIGCKSRIGLRFMRTANPDVGMGRASPSCSYATAPWT